jgi:hypothetical protein
VLGGDVVVADLLGLGLGDVHHGHQRPGQAGRRDVGAAGLGQRGEQRLGPGADLAGVGADGRQQRPGDAVALVEQGEQQVDGSDLGVSLGARPRTAVDTASWLLVVRRSASTVLLSCVRRSLCPTPTS